MKNVLLAGTSALALSLAATEPADAFLADGSWYVSLFGGYAFTDASNGKNVATTGSVYSSKIELDDGYTVGLALGSRVNDMIRAEVELSYAEADNKESSIVPPGISFGGDFQAFYVMGNVWFDLDTGTAFKPYVGGGAGIAFVDTTFEVAGASTSGDSEAFAFQLGAGLRYAVSPNVDLDVGYRYRSIPNFDHTIDTGVRLKNYDFDTHNVLATLTYNFGP